MDSVERESGEEGQGEERGEERVVRAHLGEDQGREQEARPDEGQRAGVR